MDQLKGALGSFGGGNKNNQGGTDQAPEGSSSGHPQPQSGGGGFLGGLGEKFNSAAGGGKESEKNEDYLDKGEFFRIYRRQRRPNLLLLHRYRLRSAEVHGRRRSEQRERDRASQG